MRKEFFLIFLCVLGFLGAAAFSASALTVGSTVQVVPLGLVGHWTMDGKNVNWVTGVVRDSSPTANHAMMNGLISTTTSPRPGKVGQSVAFDGTDDYLEAADNAAYSFGTAFSVAAWIKTTDSNTEIIGNFESTNPFQGFSFAMDGQGDAPGKISLYAADTQAVGFKTDTGARVDDGKWHHVAATYDGTNVRFYQDGILSSTVGLTEPIGDSSNVLRIGADNNDPIGRKLAGSLDDVRLYSRVLSLADIKLLYGQGAGSKTSASVSPGTTGVGLTGHWTFDGKDLIQNVADRSGQGNTGNLKGFVATTTIAGRIGQGIRLDGVNDYIEIADHSSIEPTTSMSIAFWCRVTTLGIEQCALTKHNVVGRSGYVGVIASDNKFYFQAGNGVDGNASPACDWCQYITTSSALSTVGWHHFVGVHDGVANTHTVYVDGVASGIPDTTGGDGSIGTNTRALWLGRNVDSDTTYWPGTFDDLRIYNRALSAAEIAQLYKQASALKTGVTPPSTGTFASGLVGHWTFDGKHTNWGTNRMTDASGTGNTGTMTNMSTTTTPVVGKIGQAFKYDGVNDVISVSDADSLDLTTDIAISAWINLRSNVDSSIVNKSTNGYNFGTQSDAKLFFGKTGVDSVTSNTSLVPNRWYHVVAVRTGGTNTIYINGVSDNSASKADFAVQTSNVGIGGAEFSGTIDDVRIYNRPLSGAEIAQLYKVGR